MAIHGKAANFYSHLSGAPSHDTSEAMSSPAGSTTEFIIDDSTKRYWDYSSNVTVYVGGAATSEDLYGVEYTGGRVIFDSAPSGAVTADCYTFSVAAIGGGFNWSLTMNGGLTETPEFEKNWMHRITGIRSWEATFDRYWANDGFATLFNRDEDIHVVLYTDISSNTKRYEGRGKFGNMDITAPPEEIVDQSISISGEGTIHYRTG